MFCAGDQISISHISTTSSDVTVTEALPSIESLVNSVTEIIKLPAF
jgi:hypothetical protein